MSQRVYWVPHTMCFLGCEHCHNDSKVDGIPASQEILDAAVDHLPDASSPYRLEEILVGGGEALMRNQSTERLLRRLRQRYPQGDEPDIAARRAGGHMILAVQSMGLPLADAAGNPNPNVIDYWLAQGMDYFHIASNDIFHEAQRPDYAWQTMRQNLADYGAEHGIYFRIYGKPAYKLVPSGRVLENMGKLEQMGANLLTAEGYCQTGWETASNFLTGQDKEHPNCSEVVIDPQGWVHPCCWYELAPGLFDLTKVDFETGMSALRGEPLCQALDQGDILAYGQIAGVERSLARQIRDRVGDCGACRLFSRRLATQSEFTWLRSAHLSPAEYAFYARHLGEETMSRLGYAPQLIPLTVLAPVQ